MTLVEDMIRASHHVDSIARLRVMSEGDHSAVKVLPVDESVEEANRRDIALAQRLRSAATNIDANMERFGR